MSKVKYILHPGYVKSRIDADEHYVDAFKLARLYGIALKECIVFVNATPGFDHSKLKDEVHLYPREDGDYRLPE